MSEVKLTWRVAEPTTGRFRSFNLRHWPTARYSGEVDKHAAFLTCEDAYSPARVRSGNHGPLTIHVAHWGRNQGGATFTWLRLKRQAATLAEGKELALKAILLHPEWLPKELQEGGAAEPEDEIWTTKDGRKLKVGDMEEAHVRDVLRMLLRMHRKRTAKDAETRRLIEKAYEDAMAERQWGDS